MFELPAEVRTDDPRPDNRASEQYAPDQKGRYQHPDGLYGTKWVTQSRCHPRWKTNPAYLRHDSPRKIIFDRTE